MKLIFATDHKTRSGRSFKVGSTHNVNDADARVLIHRGVARLAEEGASEPTPTPKPAAPADNK